MQKTDVGELISHSTSMGRVPSSCAMEWRRRREGTSSLSLQIVKRKMRMPRNRTDYLSVNENNVNLNIFLAEEWKSSWVGFLKPHESIVIFIAGAATMLSQHEEAELPTLRDNHEKADTILFSKLSSCWTPTAHSLWVWGYWYIHPVTALCLLVEVISSPHMDAMAWWQVYTYQTVPAKLVNSFSLS